MSQVKIEEYLKQAAEMGAGSLLLLPDQPPVCRVGRVLQPPMETEPLNPEFTKEAAYLFLDRGAEGALITNGNVERPFQAGAVRGQVNIFMGQGNYHLVFYIEPTS